MIHWDFHKDLYVKITGVIPTWDHHHSLTRCMSESGSWKYTLKSYKFVINNTHLVVHSSSSLERSLREALCFSSNRSFSLLAVSIKTIQKYEWRAITDSYEGPVNAVMCQSMYKSENLYVYIWLVLPMSPFSMALMSGLSRQSVGASSLSMPGSSSFSVMAKQVKLYICTELRG